MIYENCAIARSDVDYKYHSAETGKMVRVRKCQKSLERIAHSYSDKIKVPVLWKHNGVTIGHASHFQMDGTILRCRIELDDSIPADLLRVIDEEGWDISPEHISKESDGLQQIEQITAIALVERGNCTRPSCGLGGVHDSMPEELPMNEIKEKQNNSAIEPPKVASPIQDAAPAIIPVPAAPIISKEIMDAISLAVSQAMITWQKQTNSDGVKHVGLTETAATAPPIHITPSSAGAPHFDSTEGWELVRKQDSSMFWKRTGFCPKATDYLKEGYENGG